MSSSIFDPARFSIPKNLLAPRDIDIIACERPPGSQMDDTVHVYGLRWGARFDLLYPIKGWSVRRIIDGVESDYINGGNPFMLPRTDSWTNFQNDAEARRPVLGPYFPTIEEDNLGFMLPLIRLVDPHLSSSNEVAYTNVVAAFLGFPHEDDSELAWNYWQQDEPPSLAELLAGAEKSAVVHYYQRQAWNFLMALSLRFEYAVLLGLATDDIMQLQGDVVYQVEAQWPGVYGKASSDPVKTNRPCYVSPPPVLQAERVPGAVDHPAFASFGYWTFPAEMAPTDPEGNPRSTEFMTVKCPAMYSALSWSETMRPDRLLHHEAVLYQLKRFHHGAASAAQINPPALPPGAVFEEVEPGELYIRSESPPHYLDRPGLPWPPKEGHYAYRIWGVNLLGVFSSGFTETSVRHHDDLAPATPMVALVSDRQLTFDSANPEVPVELLVHWHAREDFNGPDAAEFRFAVSWIPRSAVPVELLTVDDNETLTADLTLASLPGTADQYAGTPLITTNGGFMIKSHTVGAPASMTIYKSSGRTPAANSAGVIYATEPTTAVTRVAKKARNIAIAAKVKQVHGQDPLDIELQSLTAASLPDGEKVSLYIHLLRGSFDAEPSGTNRWKIIEPGDEDLRHDTLETWRGTIDPDGLMTGSPVIVYPPHKISFGVQPPAGFLSGLLEIRTTAADSTGYVASPALPADDGSLTALHGNESAAAVAAISVRSTDPPAAPSSTPFDPDKIIWATSAAIFAENVQYKLNWGAVADTSQYEVWRVMEGSLDGVHAGMSDTDLRNLASTQSKKFDLRTNEVYMNTFTDDIPGRSPTRVIYKVRAIGISGTPGAWTDLIGPVHVPDVRRPVKPNLLAAAPPDSSTERSIRLVWTQAGAVEGVRFEVEVKNGTAGKYVLAATIPAGTAPDSEGRYSITIADLTPGLLYTFRVTAIRSALDPIDDAGATFRDIYGQPSDLLPARAIGNLNQPSDLATAYDLTTSATMVSWKNNDEYSSIEVRRKSNEGYRFETIAALESGTETFIDGTVTTGTWTYQIRGLGVSRMVNSDSSEEVEVP